MRTRIDDLLYDSGLTANGCWNELDDYAKQAIEKLVELIVLECASVCDDYGMPDGTSQTAMILSSAIKRNFGVE